VYFNNKLHIPYLVWMKYKCGFDYFDVKPKGCEQFNVNWVLESITMVIMTCGNWIKQNISWKGYQEEDNFYGILLKNIANILDANVEIWQRMINKEAMYLEIEGESTLWWSALGCHITLLSKNVHVGLYPTSKFWTIFTIVLHIMLKYNLSKILRKKLFHFIL
jgi:hypothetical protein